MGLQAFHACAFRRLQCGHRCMLHERVQFAFFCA